MIAGLRSIFSVLCILCPSLLFANTFTPYYWSTKNGAEVVFYQAMEVPMLEINLAFRAGSAYDSKFGQSALTTRLINQGNHGLDADTIADQLAETGAQFDATATQDMVVLNLKTLTDDAALNPAVHLFALIAANPDFPTPSFEHEKQQQLMSIAQSRQSPDDVANQAFFKTLYQHHPYAHPINGTDESVNTLTQDDIKQFYHQFFVANNAVIVLVGAIDKSKAEHISEQISERLTPGTKANALPKAQALSKSEYVNIPFPSSQTILRLGQLGITHHTDDYFPLMVGNYILGGGSLVSRLAYEVREKRGLTYGVYSQFSPMPGTGPFLIGLSTKNEQAKNATNVTRETLLGFLKTGVTESELTAAKQFLTGSFPLSLASNRSIADTLLKIAFYQLPRDYLNTYVANINATTVAEVKRAFDKHIQPDN